MSKYDPKKIEAKWREYWKKNSEIFSADDNSEKEKKYILDMFPYPSGDGLHVGHVESYTATDIVSRFLRMNGKNVLHPQGWDAFGLPAENYAIKTGIHPAETTKKSIETFKGQMNRMGFSYDWSREVCSADAEYYKWTQWFFLLLYKNGLAYKKKAKVNWCPSCQTVLANEQADGGFCDRCKSEVVQKDLEQWFFKITDFIEDLEKISGVVTAGLLSGLEKIDWPQSTKTAQINWIGKSEGVEFELKIKDKNTSIKVYTTRIDTAFGITYAVVAPEHEIIRKLENEIKNYLEVKQYIIKAQSKTELERTELQKEKTGVRLEGIEVVNPFTDEVVPLFVADYVLGGYGTGAVMAVPAHDSRDFEFAKKYNLPIKYVISPIKATEEKEKWYTDYGQLINSSQYTGLHSDEAKRRMTVWLEKNNLGEKKINYKLRDWLVSRQRYWGAPIPIIYCKKCGEVPVPEKDLPVLLPTDVDFHPTGESPLVNSKTFHNVKCPKCGADARRESDTMDTFVCSSWYYLRYSDPKNEKEFASREMIKKWLPVDLYVGGAEHSVLHLLYARFFTKVLHSLGYTDFDEPFLQLRHQGIILAEDGRKMSKSFGNVINPDKVVDQFGADSLRMFEMFMGPLDAMKPWNTKGIVGIVRFLEKAWKIQSSVISHQSLESKMQVLLHKTIKRVTEDIKNFRFNTAISKLMVLTNAMEKEKAVSMTDYRLLLTILSPFAPHIAEELWYRTQADVDLKSADVEKINDNYKSICLQSWPVANEKYLKDEDIEMVVQINGKVRDKINVLSNIIEDEAKKMAMKS
jgi:leucyl-tRNA synthetase